MTPELPEEHYAGVGRVAVAAAKLEAMLAQVLVSAGLADQDEDWFGATTRRPLERLRKARQEFPDGHPVRALCHDAKRALEHRNRIVHSLAYLDGAPEEPAERTVRSLPGARARTRDGTSCGLSAD